MNKQVRYGLIVTESELEPERRAGCLCHSCRRLVTVEQTAGWLHPVVVAHNGDEWAQARAAELAEAYNCPTAQALYNACRRGGIATPVTRCPAYEPVTDGETA